MGLPLYPYSLLHLISVSFADTYTDWWYKGFHVNSVFTHTPCTRPFWAGGESVKLPDITGLSKKSGRLK